MSFAFFSATMRRFFMKMALRLASSSSLAYVLPCSNLKAPNSAFVAAVAHTSEPNKATRVVNTDSAIRTRRLSNELAPN